MWMTNVIHSRVKKNKILHKIIRDMAGNTQKSTYECANARRRGINRTRGTSTRKSLNVNVTASITQARIFPFHALSPVTLYITRHDLSMCVAYDICLTFSSCFARVTRLPLASSRLLIAPSRYFRWKVTNDRLGLPGEQTRLQ